MIMTELTGSRQGNRLLGTRISIGRLNRFFVANRETGVVVNVVNVETGLVRNRAFISNKTSSGTVRQFVFWIIDSSHGFFN